MPKISRIRIINFSYNGDKRLILDELFNLHQGEDTLISLKNGGGKSVLVQALMQPILPNQPLQKRKMSDFFIRKKQPAYILIEWKLDQGGGYLLTGIAMMNKESVSQDQEEESHAIRYFTFTVHYKLSDPMDIRHLELTTKEKNRILVKGYQEAQRFLQDAKRKRGGSVSYFSDSERGDYKRHLESFNIHPDEWKTVLLPINSEEGGLIKIFEKCKTPRLLLKEWILNTVNKVLYDNQKESQSLTEMMGNLGQSMIDNEAFILERDLLLEFSKKLQGLSVSAYSLASTQAEKMEKEKELRSLEQFLHVELARITEKRSQGEAELLEIQKELARIDAEEHSEAYYVSKERFEKSKEQADRYRSQLEELEERRAKVQQDIEVLDARKLYEEILSLQVETAGIEEELKRLKEPSEDQETMTRIAYSLKMLLEEKIENLLQKQSDLKKQLEDVVEKKELGKLEAASIRKEERQVLGKESTLTGLIHQFEMREKEIQEKYQVILSRNLMKGLEEKSTAALLERIREDIERAKKNLMALEEKKKKIYQEEEALQEEIPRVRLKTKDEENNLKKLQQEISDFEKKEEKVLQCLSKYQISASKRFQKAYLKGVLKGLLEEGQEKLDHVKEEIRSLMSRKTAMENGVLHVSKEFFHHLQESGIEFDTGENYLQKHTMDLRRKLLHAMPLLPYAFLMTEEELEKLKNAMPERPLLEPVPVMTYGSLQGDQEDPGSFLLLGPGKMIFSKPDERLFESDGLDAYKKELEGRLREEEERRKHYEDHLQDLRENERLLAEFTYTESYFSEAAAAEEKLRSDILRLKEEEERLLKRREEIKKIRFEMEKEKDEKKGLLEEASKKLRILEEHLEENEAYERHLQEKDHLKKKMEELSNRLLDLEKEESLLTEKQLELERESFRTLEEQERCQKEYGHYASAPEKIMEEGSIEELQKRYKVYQEKLDGNMKRLEETLRARVQVLKSKEKELLKKEVPSEEYLHIKYLESEGDRLLGLRKQLETAYQKDRKISEEASSEAAKLSGVCENMLESLKSRGGALLPKEDIHGRYKERKAECSVSRKRLEDQVKNLENTRRSYVDLRIQIEEKLRMSKIKVSTMVWPGDRDVETGFKEVSGELSELLRKMEEEKIRIQQSFWNLRDSFKEKHQNITGILHQVGKMQEMAERDPDNYYYLYEYMENQLEVLRKLIHVQEIRLEKMENTFQDMVMQSYNLSKEIYDHVNRIAEDSSIQLDGRNRKVKMIEILLRDLEPEEKGIESMRSYIKECASEVKDQLKAGKGQKEVRDLISKFMSSEELLNVISNLSDLRIKAYKVDINAQNSKAKDWEKVMRENSGGERFVSFFAVMIALMSYARNSRKDTEDYGRKNQDAKVLLMDNPFGPISSDHLLKPLFDIAKKYNTQLICLTDLKQNSIMNQFKVIFMMKIVENTSGTMEYLKVEESTYNGEEEPAEENLEMLHYHQEVEQMSLLGDE
jgi:hypothetical protein